MLLCFIVAVAAVLPHGTQYRKVSSFTQGYAVVVTDGAPFFADASGKLIRFYLDESYYVFVTDVLGDLSRVLYMETLEDAPTLEGYVKTADISFVSQPVTSPYPDFLPVAKNDAVLFSDVATFRPKSVIYAGSTVRYLGSYYDQSGDYFFVYYQGVVGYVFKNDLQPFDIPLHPDYAIVTQNEVDISEPSERSGDDSSIKTEPSADNATVIIVSIALVVSLAVLFLLLRPDKTVKVDKDDQNEYF